MVLIKFRKIEPMTRIVTDDMVKKSEDAQNPSIKCPDHSRLWVNVAWENTLASLLIPLVNPVDWT